MKLITKQPVRFKHSTKEYKNKIKDFLTKYTSKVDIKRKIKEINQQIDSAP